MRNATLGLVVLACGPAIHRADVSNCRAAGSIAEATLTKAQGMIQLVGFVSANSRFPSQSHHTVPCCKAPRPEHSAARPSARSDHLDSTRRRISPRACCRSCVRDCSTPVPAEYDVLPVSGSAAAARRIVSESRDPSMSSAAFGHTHIARLRCCAMLHVQEELRSVCRPNCPRNTT